jgi:membrane protein
MMTRFWHWLSRASEATRAALAMTAAFTRYSIGRFVADGCLTGAGALSYTTLIALVPVTAIALAVLSAFPVFADMRDQLLATVFRSFVPEVGVEVEWWLRYFAGTSVRTTAIGIVALAIAVVLLLATIEDQLHHIWRVESPRPWVQRILAYWAVLTLGPVLLAVSFSLPSYLDILAARTGLDPQAIGRAPSVQTLLRLLPVVLETVTFTLVYALIPNCAVRWREAAAGAVVVAALMEGLKAGFALYVGHLSSYRAVYGALAAIPIFLLWMYLAWSVVLFGAVIAAALPQWRADERAKDATPSAHRLGLCLALLAELAAQQRQGGMLATAVLAERLGVATAAVEDDLGLLRQAGMVAAADGGWVLARALEGLRLIDLYRALGLPLASALSGEGAYPWEARIASALQKIAAAENASLSLSLGELVGAGAPIAPFPQSTRHRR